MRKKKYSCPVTQFVDINADSIMDVIPPDSTQEFTNDTSIEFEEESTTDGVKSSSSLWDV